MSAVSTIGRLLGFRKMIRIERKGFSDLTTEEMASLIESHLGRIDDRFDGDALYEFISVPNRKPELECIRQEISRISLEFGDSEEPDGLDTPHGKETLMKLAENLRSLSFNPSNSANADSEDAVPD